MSAIFDPPYPIPYNPINGTVEAFEGTIRPVYNVLDYGADPTGVVPSASAVQKAANDLEAAGGGTLYGIGTFLIESPILLPSNCTVAGAGAGVTTWKQGFAASGIDAQGVFENADTVAGNPFISFRDCTILCTPVTGASPNLSTSTCAVYFQGCSDASFHNIVAQNGTLKGLPLPSEANTPNVNTTGLNHRWHFSNVRGDSGAEGIYWQQGTGLVTDPDCVFTNSYDSTVSVNSSGEQIILDGIFDKQGNVYDAEGCIELNNDGAGDTNGIRDVIVRATCLNNGNASSQGMVATGVTGLRLDGCESRGHAGNGALLQNCDDVRAGGGFAFDGNSLSGVKVAASTCTGFTMTGGSAANNSEHGISWGVATATDVAIVGVNLRGNAGGAVDVFGPVTRGKIADCAIDLVGDVNINGQAGWIVRGCAPYNPVGPVTVAVPASGSATAALPYDATFYITQVGAVV